MPYILPEDRPQYEEAINDIVSKFDKLQDAEIQGHMNYVFFSIFKRIAKKKGYRYARLSAYLSSLFCCFMEIYRTIVGPYEDEAIAKNGNVGSEPLAEASIENAINVLTEDGMTQAEADVLRVPEKETITVIKEVMPSWAIIVIIVSVTLSITALVATFARFF